MILDRADRSAGPAGCWPFQGARQTCGYGATWLGLAHRRSYAENVGPIPAGLCVLHRCDNPPCVNPAHLFLGTQAENVADMVAKGRCRSGGPSGEGHPGAKLTAAAVSEIRESQSPQRVIAARLGISQSQVSRIKRRESWSGE